MQSPYEPPNTEVLSEQSQHTRSLVYVAPFPVATSITGALLALSILISVVLRFFQLFDPTPPPRDSISLYLVVGGVFASLITCFVAVLASCWCFNFFAPRMGGIRYKMRSV